MESLKIAVFDLNKTLYKKSSKDEFFLFIGSKNPARFRYKPEMIFYQLEKKFKLITRTEFKENFYNYLNHLNPGRVGELGREFWQREFPDNFNRSLLQRIGELKSQNIEIVVITGAIENYIRPLFDQFLAVDNWMGTKVHYENKTYKVVGKACKGNEKLIRLQKAYRGRKIEIVEAYSDKKEKILENAVKAYLVNGSQYEAITAE